VRILEVFGQQIKLLQYSLDVWLDDRARPARHDRGWRGTDRIGDGSHLSEVSYLCRATYICDSRKYCTFDDRSEQHVRSKVCIRQAPGCRLDRDSLALAILRGEDEREAGDVLHLGLVASRLDLARSRRETLGY
jgi:hypothetical protein